ncbi:MAG TPA: hypothetical protein VHA82_08290 [Ramlibacter sp.]|uniref:hypothetical protein n=1 Tax=Ramlibacter sp. TaxID=1917967 RepID=UPI002CAAD729|nr:hypothetical protein [Ramlibacter sp.]HVZ43795.1 hypothetical protein [Ramlibacter sp.]
MEAVKRIVGRLFAWPLALLILFEEWGWQPLQRGLARLMRALGLERIEASIRKLPPYAALALFLVPTLLLLPVKIAALWFIGRGRVLFGTGVIVVAKIAGTALVARLFTLTRESLMQLAWFARVYARWVAFKEELVAQVRASWPWRIGRVAKRRWRRRFEAWRHG